MPNLLRVTRPALAVLITLCATVFGCSSSTTSAPDTSSLNGDAGGVGGNASITGTFGTDTIKPIVAAYWIGVPGDANESAGGPFIYLFTSPVTCDDISKGSDWVSSLPSGTQVLEMIVGTTSPATPVNASAHAGGNVAEVNYFFAQTSAEARATSGPVTLTTYTKDVAVDGTIDVAFPMGSTKGTFHATWCAGGHERG